MRGLVGENGRKMKAQSRTHVLAGHLGRKSQENPDENALQSPFTKGFFLIKRIISDVILNSFK